MAAKKKTSRRRKRTTTRRRPTRSTARKTRTRRRAVRRTTTRRGRSAVRGRARRAATRFERTWRDALHALEGAEKQVEKEIRSFIKRSGLDTREAAALWKQWNARLARERRKAAKQLEVGLADLQARARKESRAFGRMVDDAVRGALAALNIPSRQEVQQLTRRVNELSRKIDGFRR